MTALVREAATQALREHMNIRPLALGGALGAGTSEAAAEAEVPQSSGAKVLVVEMSHFMTANLKIRPSVSQEVGLV